MKRSIAFYRRIVPHTHDMYVGILISNYSQYITSPRKITVTFSTESLRKVLYVTEYEFCI